MFAFKIISKKVQDTNCFSEYVENIFIKDQCRGKQAMTYCLQVATSKLENLDDFTDFVQPCWDTDHDFFFRSGCKASKDPCSTDLIRTEGK